MSLRTLKSTKEILQQLKSGSGAAQLPSNISKIALTFALKGKNESASARHFLNENLPRIQYNNPQVEYEVNKVADANIKPTVTLHFRNGASKTLDIARVKSSTICDQIFAN
ncbi:hypothetical protein G6F46_012362 [Rhizopus delemar]|uniref:Ribosomal protein/NADH dehydrogenase domain-containing protein n=3 Tax=Rhizopus TaxID=4842 RepID=I1BX76_RHIO9|nr:hypothetical protein RO3G_05511 [Rhizopus delemar RA 99-880]KAG0779363.1 hypothetical protein G6F21_012619 [Rhizopus arrhizus]KAG1047898.1 hypothetical protein G6F43_009679 [Rhizopus delemar]KAG0824374.1 hypothetical protein G6F18_010914 [Rhizopus arrhizus]KAG0849257.1 hypothetical protein G6F17_010932 [Rhizopus arrhizus]|eukprot:EIE80806.1 hypothetical protein RO3G_05511 [Rhizopus delemar RA 99-880]